MSKPSEIAASPGVHDAGLPEARISLEAFRELLDQLHPFAGVLGIEILDIRHGQATLRLPPNPANQRLGGIVAGPMLMGRPTWPCTRPWSAPPESRKPSPPA